MRRSKLGYTGQWLWSGGFSAIRQQVTEGEVNKLTADYDDAYTVAESLRKGGSKRQSLLEAAKIEIGLRRFLQETGSHAFTDTFEDLHGLAQLPGIAVQRLMADGYGFGAEGDWKTAALVRATKVMSHGLKGGASFMEDYTYHLKDGAQVLGAHMLEVCPSITNEKPTAEIHPLSIGGKADPVRLVFTAAIRQGGQCVGGRRGKPVSVDRQSSECDPAPASSAQAYRLRGQSGCPSPT